MPRIPNSELMRLKTETDLASLVRSHGVELKPHGDNLIGLCPFHADKEPSLVVTPAKNLWHCLGACQSGGSVIDWVMKAEGVSFREAVERLKSVTVDNSQLSATMDGDKQQAAKGRSSASPSKLPPVSSPTANRQPTTDNSKRKTIRTLPPSFAASEDDRALLKQVIAYYHETLLKTPSALDYLAKRGIRNEEAIMTFKLGYADRSLGLRLPFKNRKDGAEIRARLTRIGILRVTGHEHFHGSLVIPVIAEGGEITEVYGRKTGDELRAGTAYHLYLPGPHRGVWNSAGLISGTIILCEALIDALTFWVNGFKNVTASYGIEGFSDEHLSTFKNKGIDTVYLAYDHDQAGDAAAEKLADKLIAEGFTCYRVKFPMNMDANEYAVKMQPPRKALELVLR